MASRSIFDLPDCVSSSNEISIVNIVLTMTTFDASVVHIA
jgi:hypothetical protein